MGGFVNMVSRIGSGFRLPDEGRDAAFLEPVLWLWSHFAVPRLLVDFAGGSTKSARTTVSVLLKGPGVTFGGVQPLEPSNAGFPGVQPAGPFEGEENAPGALFPHGLLRA